MQYGRIPGPIYCRFAGTAPVRNSAHADVWGIEAVLDRPPARGSAIEAGRNVKLRVVLDDSRQRVTCHARIDAVERDPATDRYAVRFGALSLSDAEFDVLYDASSAADGGGGGVTFVDTVRGDEAETTPALVGGDGAVPVRDKAVTMPVDLIESIDEQRGDTPFSKFVVELVRAGLDGS